MSYINESELRSAFLERLESLTPDIEERLQNFDYRVQNRRGRPRTRIAGAIGTAVLGGGAAAILLFSSGTTAAYAGWTAVPSSPSHSALQAAIASCQTVASHALDPAASDSALCGSAPTLSDQRGSYVALLYATSGVVSEFIAGTNGGGTISGEQIPSEPAPTQLSEAGAGTGATPTTSRSAAHRHEIDHLQSLAAALAGYSGPPSQLALSRFHFAGLARQMQGKTNTEAISEVNAKIASLTAQEPQLATADSTNDNAAAPVGSSYGRAGADVSAVTFTFADGSSVDATVENGWYFAWWPGGSRPTSVSVTANSTTVTTPM